MATMGTREGPWEWLCGWCHIICQGAFTCCRLGSLCPQCGCECCSCRCCPAWCPRKADQLAPDEVTADDYTDPIENNCRPRINGNGRMKSAIRSFFAFVFGLLLITAYAYIVLFQKNYNMWFCLISTISIGFFISIGMAFSIRFRITVMLMFPHILSGQGKAVIMLIILSMTAKGPSANMLENYHRAALSISCEVNMAINQTIEVLKRFKEPITKVLNFLHKIGNMAKTVAGKAKLFFASIWEKMKEVGNFLQKIWKFITNIGEVCNNEMLRPYKKCIKDLDDAKENCFRLKLSFLCEIVEIGRPACNLAKIATWICVIPHYVGKFIKVTAQKPVLFLTRSLNRIFDFNVTIHRSFGITVNSSKSLATIFQEIREDVDQGLEPYREFFQMFSYSVLFICLYTYVQALRYHHSYIFDDNFDNIYITRAFVDLDNMRLHLNRKPLLPLSIQEAYDFIRPGALRLTNRERKGYKFELINVFRSMLSVALIILCDYMSFWILDTIASFMMGDIAFRSAMYGTAFVASAAGVYIQRLKRLICAYYYPFRERERVCFLYNKLVTKRQNILCTLWKTMRMNTEDEGHSSIPLILATKCPGLSCIVRLMGADGYECYCMACAKMSTPHTNEDFVSCITPNCRGLFCKSCSEILNRVCNICMGPLSYSKNLDEELDSSDDEKIHLWIEAMTTLKEEKTKRKTMQSALKNRLKDIIRRRGMKTKVVQKYTSARKDLSDSDGESSEFSGTQSVDGSTDHEYQDRSEDSDSGPEELLHYLLQ
ncbi:DC-STAMP domain-containing protein 2 isoform X2 [Hyperolius riggenbachi]|uniref:DC-STAMP domain-containing protein 2 isoform X2 n=1 Tax=Hyperolius riggenbachi TaxID=752182 RepID=UPI0035A285CD